MAEVEIPYQPREWALQLHDAPERWKVLVCHRRAGKTVSAINHIQRDALLTPNSRFAYIAPTYKQAKMIAWDMAKHYSRVIPDVKYNESELRVDYPNGSRIQLFGADNPDSLRGIALWGVVFDEYSQQPSNIYTEIIRPALADHKGYAIWIGTPKGHNAFYDLYEYGKETDNWLSLRLTVEDTGLIDEEELNDARRLMTPDEFEQEWHCSFEAAIKGAYYADQLAETREKGRITNVEYQEATPVHTYWDLGIGDATSIVFAQKAGQEWHVIDYYENSGEGLAHYVKVLQGKPYIYGTHYAPHDIQVKELGTGVSRWETAKNLGIKFEVVPQLSIDDGINALRLLFKQLWFDKEKCSHLVEALSLYHKEWDDKRGVFKDKPYHDWTSHPADAMRYMAVAIGKMNNKSSTKIITPAWQGYNKR